MYYFVYFITLPEAKSCLPAYLYQLKERRLKISLLLLHKKGPSNVLILEEEEEEEPLLIYTAQGSPFRCKKLSVINGSPEQQCTKTH